MIYLASPYSHDDPAVRVERFQAVCHAAAALIRRGYLIFSPIVYTHSIVVGDGLPMGFDFWERHDCEFVAACEEVWILTLPGWAQSRGVQAELALAEKLGKPIRFADPETLEVTLSGRLGEVDEAITVLREAGLRAWDDVPDPDALIREMRGT
jgi:hypothetical protein